MRTLFLLLLVATFAGCRPTIFDGDGHQHSDTVSHDHDHRPVDDHDHDEPALVRVNESARKNFKIFSQAARKEAYQVAITVPGMVVDHPGCSDRRLVSPVAGTIARIFAFPGERVKSGTRLFSIRIFSEHLQMTQAELFKANRELQLIADEQNRIQSGVQSGAISAGKMIELDNQAKRQRTVLQSYRQELLTRGLSPAQIDAVAEGNFVSEIDIVTPEPHEEEEHRHLTKSPTDQVAYEFELQELDVELGQQIQAGQLLTKLADHRFLYLRGDAFPQETAFVTEATEKKLPIAVEFVEEDKTSWPKDDQAFTIRHLASTIDEQSRTLAFFVSLENRSRTYEKDGRSFTIWRYRPGQRVRLSIPTGAIPPGFVFPREAVAESAGEAFVFQQNGDLFRRVPVSVIHRDRTSNVIADDGAIVAGLYYAQSGAAALNRMLQAQAAGGVDPGIHVHADGSVHQH